MDHWLHEQTLARASTAAIGESNFSLRAERLADCYAVSFSQEGSMRISNVRVLLLSAPIPPERRWTSDFGTNTKQDDAIVIVETDAGLSGYGEAKGTPVVMKVLVEDVLGPQLV